jgi:hypothetical protein
MRVMVVSPKPAKLHKVACPWVSVSTPNQFTRSQGAVFKPLNDYLVCVGLQSVIFYSMSFRYLTISLTLPSTRGRGCKMPFFLGFQDLR